MFDKRSPWSRQRCGFATLLGLLVLSACHSTNEPLQRQYHLEKKYFQAQKIAEAIAINPRIAPAKDFANAIALFRQVIKEADAQPTTAMTVSLIKPSLAQIARLEMMQDQVDAAIATYREILQRFPDDDAVTEARLALGLLYQRSLEYRDAISAYAGLLPNLASRLAPQDPNRYLLGIPLQFARLHKFAAMDSQSQTAYGQASAIYQQIMTQWSDSKAAALAKNYYAALLADQGRWDELKQLLDEQIHRHADRLYIPERLYLKALLLYSRLRQTDLAMQLFQDILARYPDHEIAPHAKLAIAKIYLEQKNYAEARQRLKTIVEKHRRTPAVAALAQYGLARSFELEGRWDLALNEYRWLAEQYETSPAAIAAPFHIADYYVRRNDVAMIEKAYREAITYYQSLSRKYPQSLVAALAQEQIANCFIAQKKWDDAIAAATNIREVLDSKIGRLSSYLLLGNIYEATGQNRLAAKAYNEIIEQFPQHFLARPLREKVRNLMNS